LIRAVDLAVLATSLAALVAFGLWRARHTRDLPEFLVAGRSMPWPMVALSVMATQASAVTFMATPGQGYVGGLSFVQFYFGLPVAMVVLCATPRAALPAAADPHGLRVPGAALRRQDAHTRGHAVPRCSAGSRPASRSMRHRWC
jgi:Na+/pantothenate symporter